jgi:hypothetical protein
MVKRKTTNNDKKTLHRKLNKGDTKLTKTEVELRLAVSAPHVTPVVLLLSDTNII